MVVISCSYGVEGVTLAQYEKGDWIVAFEATIKENTRVYVGNLTVPELVWAVNHISTRGFLSEIITLVTCDNLKVVISLEKTAAEYFQEYMREKDALLAQLKCDIPNYEKDGTNYERDLALTPQKGGLYENLEPNYEKEVYLIPQELCVCGDPNCENYDLHLSQEIG